MSQVCGFCAATIVARKPAVLCDGGCGSKFHISCVGLPADYLQLKQRSPGLNWTCNDCTRSCVYVNPNAMLQMFESKAEALLSNLLDSFNGMKAELMQQVAQRITSFSPNNNVKSYASVVRNTTTPAVLVVPKDQSQSGTKTKSALLENIDPLELDVHLSQVKDVKNGGVLVGCRNSEENEKFKRIVTEKLSKDYEIRQLRGINPRIRVVGISDKLTGDEVKQYVIKMNSAIFDECSECNVLEVSKLKRANDVYQAVLQLDRASYDRSIKAGYLFIGYDCCRVYDAVSVLRCFNCSGFNHSAKQCTKPIACPRCGGAHKVADCSAQQLNCVNCVGGGVEMTDVAHAAWDTKCPSYIKAVDRLRSELLAVQ